MRVAVLTGTFPLLSETFVLRHVTGLLDAGHDVRVYAEGRPPADAPVHPDFEVYGLAARTQYVELPAAVEAELPVRPLRELVWPPGACEPQRNVTRVVRAAPQLARAASGAPRLTVEVLRQARYGHEAASLSGLYRLAALAGDRTRHDVVHAHFGPVASNLRFAGRLWRSPFVVTFHGYDFSSWPARRGSDVYRALFPAVDAVTVNSDHAGRRLRELGCPERLLRRLNIAVDVERFAPSARERRAGEPVRVLSVGRLTEKKGHDTCLRAVARAAREVPLELDVAGDGPLRGELEALATELGVRVRFHGAASQAEVRRLMEEAHVFVLASRTAADGDQEGTPVVLLEAQASALPVVSTRHSGIPEIVVDGGHLVDEGDDEALARALVRLAGDPDECRRLGEAGRRHVLAHHDRRVVDAELERIYEELVA